MRGRALVIGASNGPSLDGESGEERDAERMLQMLAARGFEVEVLRGADATRDGIIGGYLRLIERVMADDAAVIYFTGLGGLVHNMEVRTDDPLPRRFYFIAPSDYAQTTEDDFRGISAWELSLLLAQLTARTHNVTVIFDCSYAAQMNSVSPDAVPPASMSGGQGGTGAMLHAPMSSNRAAPGVGRPLPKPTRVGIRRHYDRVRARFGEITSAHAMENPHAVRFSACTDWQCSFSTSDAQGRRSGLFTHALLAMLEEVEEAPVSWRALGDAIRTRVFRSVSMQRPVVEGPVRRQLFSLSEIDDTSLPIATHGEVLRLGAGRIAGVTPSHVYGVTRLGARGFNAEIAIARVRVVQVEALYAITEVKRRGDVRRAKLYYLRSLRGNAAKIREKV